MITILNRETKIAYYGIINAKFTGKDCYKLRDPVNPADVIDASKITTDTTLDPN